MKLRIKTTDFSGFAGMRWDRPENKELDEYINIFKANDNLTAFQIEDEHGQMEFHIVCYCCERLRGCDIFSKVERDDNGNILSYWLCFHKVEE